MKRGVFLIPEQRNVIRREKRIVETVRFFDVCCSCTSLCFMSKHPRNGCHCEERSDAAIQGF